MSKKAHDAAKKTERTSASSKKRNSRKTGAAAADPSRQENGQFKAGHPHQWQPGQSGNPAGRPKWRTLSEAYRAQLRQVDPDDPDGRTFAEVIAERQVKVAAGRAGVHCTESSTNAAKEIADRTEGKARQAIDLGLKDNALQHLAAILGCSVDELPEPTEE